MTSPFLIISCSILSYYKVDRRRRRSKPIGLSLVPWEWTAIVLYVVWSSSITVNGRINRGECRYHVQNIITHPPTPAQGIITGDQDSIRPMNKLFCLFTGGLHFEHDSKHGPFLAAIPCLCPSSSWNSAILRRSLSVHYYRRLLALQDAYPREDGE